MMTFAVAVAVLSLGLTAAPTAAATLIAPIPLDALLRMHTFGEFLDISYSPNGRWIAFTLIDNGRHVTVSDASVERTGMNWNGIGGDVCVVDTRTGNVRNLTGGRGNNYAPSWSPDGKTLAFISDRGGRAPSAHAGLWAWDMQADHVRSVVPDANVKAFPNTIAWLDATTVVLAVLPQALNGEAFAGLMASGAPAPSPGPASGATVRVYGYGTDTTRDAPRSDFANLDLYLADIVAIDVGSGAMRRLVTGRRISAFAVAPNRQAVAFAAPTGFAALGSAQIVGDLGIVRAGGGPAKILGRAVPFGYNGTGFSWSPAGSLIAFQETGTATGGQVVVFDTSGAGAPHRIGFTSQTAPGSDGDNPPRWYAGGDRLAFIAGKDLWTARPTDNVASLRAHLPGKELQTIGDYEGRLWSPDGRVAIVAYRDVRTKSSGFTAVDLADGRVIRRHDEAASIGGLTEGSGFAVAPDGRTLAYLSEAADKPTDIWLTGVALRDARQLTRTNPELGHYAMGRSRLISWTGLDGQPLHGALLLPPGATANRRHPLLVSVYGGANLSDELNRFGGERGAVDNLQLFTSRGYAVLLPDAPLRVPTPMTDIAKTILPGIDAAVATGFVDPDRVGVMGHSFGGYTTMSLIVQSSRFKAALVSAGEADLPAAYLEMAPDGTAYQIQLFETGQGRMGGTLWEQPMRYIENSPIYHLDRVQTPLLIVHGTGDTAVAPFLTDQIFVGLRRLGKTVSYARYEGEDHWPGTWSYANQLDYLTRVFAWFQRYLMQDGK